MKNSDRTRRKNSWYRRSVGAVIRLVRRMHMTAKGKKRSFNDIADKTAARLSELKAQQQKLFRKLQDIMKREKDIGAARKLIKDL